MLDTSRNFEQDPRNPVESVGELSPPTDAAISNAEQIIQEALTIYRTGLARTIRRIDMGAVREILRAASLTLRRQRVVAHVAWREDVGQEFAEFCGRDILGPGHGLRLLLHRDATRAPAARHRLRRLIEAGAEVRLSPAPPPNLITLGPDTGVVQTEDREEPSGLLLQHTEMVDLLRRVHGALWEQAVSPIHAPPVPSVHAPPVPPVHAPPAPHGPAAPVPPFPPAPPALAAVPSGPSGADAAGGPSLGVLGRIAADSVQSQVLRLLCSGAKDEAAARQMGVSVRTYRRYVARILKSLDVTSRFQAGIRAAELGLVAHRAS
ncbi:LuxR C-terminal-related transcriptional regulator [Streptomyces sp. NPDC001941]|uniref:response regulator transcription factor n=1 Tax=Streptomyces sp. NPDC001941 TaxID=3154659 RepID=UPI00332D7AB4